MIFKNKIAPLILLILFGCQILIPSPVGKIISFTFFFAFILFNIFFVKNISKELIIICIIIHLILSIAFFLFNVIEIDFKNSTQKSNSKKIIQLNNTEIYLNEENKEFLTTYKGFDEIYPLIEGQYSEMSSKYFSYYKLNDDIRYSFPTHLSSIGTEYLLEIKDKYIPDATYILKTYITPENHISLIATAGFKELLKLDISDGSQITVYINQETKEILLYNGQIVLNHKYFETPYNINDYFSVRYSKFTKEDNYKYLAENVTVEMVNTISEISDDLKRITFYNEIGDETTMKTIVEIVVNDSSYIFRTNPIDSNLIIKAVRNLTS